MIIAYDCSVAGISNPLLNTSCKEHIIIIILIIVILIMILVLLQGR